jgi:hypothetical protein
MAAAEATSGALFDYAARARNALPTKATDATLTPHATVRLLGSQGLLALEGKLTLSRAI